jgi:epoxide hydrolase
LQREDGVSREVVVQPLRPILGKAALEDLRHRLSRSRIPRSEARGWERGVPADWLIELLADWRSFDTDRLQSRLDELTHGHADLDGQQVHFVHAPGCGPEPLPLLLTHGWPGSFCEYLGVLGQLSDPASHGGDPADSFSVIAPSLPGFGFSAPERPPHR